MRNRLLLFLLPLAMTLIDTADAAPVCATRISELGTLLDAQTFPQKWEETTMDDGKPLVMSIVESKGSLLLAFTKTGEGLWVESLGVICKAGAHFEVRFSREEIRLGPAAGWILRRALGNGGKFTIAKLGPNRLRVATRGWSGEFSAIPPQVSP